MTAVLASLQLQLVCQWIVPGNHSVINGNNYSPAVYSPPLPAFPNLGREYGGYNGKSADPSSGADQNINGSAGRRSPTDLPKGYMPFSQHRAAYKIHEELATWNEARERCIAEGGYLAIIDSRDKIAGIRSMNNQSDNWLHVGIYNSADGNQWVRVDNGLAVTSLPWAYEDSKLTGSCAGISLFRFGLVNYLCSRKREHFVCEIPITGGNHLVESSTRVDEVTPTPTSPTATLPEGYVRFPEDRVAYKIHQEEKSWKDARDTCISEGARLAITDSREKIQHIRSLPTFLYRLYVGIYKPENGTEWVRIDNGLPVSSIPWYSRSPDTTQHGCALIFARNGLANYGCLLDQPFVCEIPDSDEVNSKQLPTEVAIKTPTPTSPNGTQTDGDQEVSNNYDSDQFTHDEADSTTSPPQSPAAALPEGYVRLSKDRAAYKIHLEKKSWYDARDTCISEGARLAITDSKKKLDHIKSLPTYRPYMWLLVGIHMRETGADEWVRVDDGSPVPSSIPWWKGFPDGQATDRCAQLSIERGGLINYACSSSESFICEIPISDDDNGKEHEE